MSFATMTNLIVALLCCGVLIQTGRLMRRLRAVTGGSLPEMVHALDRSTEQARAVLSALRDTLSRDGVAAGRLVVNGRAISEELEMMIEIGNGCAQRITDAAQDARALAAATA